MAGYSGTPLPKKLGIKENHVVAILNGPSDFADALAPLPAGVTCTTDVAAGEPYDIILLFTQSRGEFQRRLASLTKKLQPNGGLWICWPKKASGVATDMTEDTIREVALPTGLVDNKVCAIDDTWSGLRLVIRIENRPKKK